MIARIYFLAVPNVNSLLIKFEKYIKITLYYKVYVTSKSRPRVVIPIEVGHVARTINNYEPIGYEMPSLEQILDNKSKQSYLVD